MGLEQKKSDNIQIKKEFSNKSKILYDKYCEVEKEYRIELKDLEEQKKVLNKEKSELFAEKNKIEKEKLFSEKKRKESEKAAIYKKSNLISEKIKEEKKKIIKEYEKKLEAETQRYKSEKYELEIDRKKDSILKKIFSYFNGYYKNREDEINERYISNTRRLESEKDRELKRVEKTGKEELEIFENDLLFKSSLNKEDTNSNYLKIQIENNKKN